MKTRNSSIGIATGDGLENRCSIPCRAKKCSLLQEVHTGSWAHPASYTVDTVGKAAGV
jgi:hypothetical protein